MKKRLSFFLALCVAASMIAGCARTNPGPTGDDTLAAESPLVLLETVWERFTENEKFSVYGGDTEHSVDGKPGVFSDPDGLRNNLMVPQAQVENIEQAASLTHGMMVNNFTCGAYRLKSGTDTAAFCKAMRDSFKDNQWLCGTPENLFIASVGQQYVVAAFGLQEVLSAFAEKLTAAYPATQTRYSESIA